MLIPLTDEDQPVDVPYATFTLIGLNILVFTIFGYSQSYPELVRDWGYTPSHPTPLTPITALFLHADIVHLLGNMLYLWVVGPNMEAALGRPAFACFFIACGCFGNFAHGQMASPDAMILPCLGASGAIAGALGAYLLLYPRNKIRFFFWFWVARGTFSIAAVFPILLWFWLQFMMGTQHGQATEVAYGAHLGGFCVGAIAAGLLVLMGVVEPRWEGRRSRQQYW